MRVRHRSAYLTLAPTDPLLVQKTPGEKPSFIQRAIGGYRGLSRVTTLACFPKGGDGQSRPGAPAALRYNRVCPLPRTGSRTEISAASNSLIIDLPLSLRPRKASAATLSVRLLRLSDHAPSAPCTSPDRSYRTFKSPVPATRGSAPGPRKKGEKRGKEVKIQGISVLATRNPML